MLSTRYLLLMFASLLFAQALSAEWIGCPTPTSFAVEVDNVRKIFVYDAEINVKYERNELAVYDYSDTDAVNILLNNTAVFFAGHVIPEFETYDPTVYKTSRVLNTKIAGSARLMKSQHNDDTLAECQLYLSRNRKEDGVDLPVRLQIEILHRAASCVRSEICAKFGKITLDDLRNAKNHPFAFGPLAVRSKTTSDQRENPGSTDADCGPEQKMNFNLTSLVSSAAQINSNSVNAEGLQSTVNMLVDLAIAEIVRMAREENKGHVKIPNISESFSEDSFWKPHGEFDAIKGDFSDLTTLYRAGDATLSHTGMKFIASCGFGLSKANIKYDKYKLKYGLIRVSGKLLASVNGVALATIVAVDYNQQPCRAILQELRVTRLGNLKINITGLGPLNSLLSRLITWITKKWKGEIVTMVEHKVRGIIEKHLNQFDCEKYRP